MSKLRIAGGVVALVALVVAGYLVRGRAAGSAAGSSPAAAVESAATAVPAPTAAAHAPPAPPPPSAALSPPADPGRSPSPAFPAASPDAPNAPVDPRGFLHARVTTLDGATFQGRLRFGEGEEAFWSDFFNGTKVDNPWVAYVPKDKLPTERESVGPSWLKFGELVRPMDFRRLFMVRLGDIVRIEGGASEIVVTVKSGTKFRLDRQDASDFDDGVRIWDEKRGMVDLDSLRVRTIEMVPANAAVAGSRGDAPQRLYGTVRTDGGQFTGFVQWNRDMGVGSDELHEHTKEGPRSVRFDSIRSIARRGTSGVTVTLKDGSVIEMSGGRSMGDRNRGTYVDDARYGRVLIAWGAFERVDFASHPVGSGPAYADFPPGEPLFGSVVTRSGARLAGRLVYDLDESETTESLDAPSRGVNHNIPFGLVASIVLEGSEQGAKDAHARVTLRGGEELQLSREGDLGPKNAGMLVFVDGKEKPEYVPWGDVARIDFDPPAARNNAAPLK